MYSGWFLCTFSVRPNVLGQVRHYIYQYMVENSYAPPYEEIALEFGMSIDETHKHLQQLMDDHLIVLQPDTHRILFVNPLSSIATDFRVRDLTTGKGYFANCGWDAVGTHFMLDHPIRIETHCQQTLEKIVITVEDHKIVESSHPDALIFMTKPVSKWWDNVIDTCSNHMFFFISPEAAQTYADQRGLAGHGLSNEQLYVLSEFLYGDKLELDYQRPTVEETKAIFEKLSLTGEFWEI